MTGLRNDLRCVDGGVKPCSLIHVIQRSQRSRFVPPNLPLVVHLCRASDDKLFNATFTLGVVFYAHAGCMQHACSLHARVDVGLSGVDALHAASMSTIKYA